MDLGAWVTLANGNGVGFPAARTQVVAGRVQPRERRGRTDRRRRPDPGAVLAARLDQRSCRNSCNSPSSRRWEPIKRMNRAAALPQAMPAAATRDHDQRTTEWSKNNSAILSSTACPSAPPWPAGNRNRCGCWIGRPFPSPRCTAPSSRAATPPLAPADQLLRTVNNAANHLGLPLPSGTYRGVRHAWARALLVARIRYAGPGGRRGGGDRHGRESGCARHHGPGG